MAHVGLSGQSSVFPISSSVESIARIDIGPFDLNFETESLKGTFCRVKLVKGGVDK